MLKNIDFVSASLYDDPESATNGGVEMTAQEALTAALTATGYTQAEAAKAIGWQPQRLSQRLVRGSLKVEELFQILDAIGVDFNMTVRETGKPVRTRTTGYGRRVRAMSDRVMYDTAMSYPLANSFWDDGEHEYDAEGKATELYIDREGRYFLAKYSVAEDEKDKVQAIDGDLAAAYIERHGTTLDKRPKE